MILKYALKRLADGFSESMEIPADRGFGNLFSHLPVKFLKLPELKFFKNKSTIFSHAESGQLLVTETSVCFLHF